MDSSPDLSLKLRRGSSDSRDNFYMDFAQGIDSDIEEVDNTALQEPTAPPLPIVDELDYVGIPPPPPPVMSVMTQPQVLPTLSEHDDLPSPPVSPTSSVLEMMPPPPISPVVARRPAQPQPPSPPIETEDEDDDEAEDGADADIEETPDEEPENMEIANDKNVISVNGIIDIGEENDENRCVPPPPPNQYSYSPSNDDDQLPQPMQGSTPSISPSPPITPPPCPELTSLAKIVSPPPVHVSQIPPLTPPSESDQSQPNSPTPPKQKTKQSTMATTPPPPPEYDMEERETSTPPPEFAELTKKMQSHPQEGSEDEEAIDLSAVIEAPSLNLVQEILQEVNQELEPEETKSANDDESTTITTPPTNGYSGSSILGQHTEQIDEIEQQDNELLLVNIPPPPGLEDGPEQEPIEEEEAEDDDDDDDDEKMRTRTPVSETKPLDLDEDSAPPSSQVKDEQELIEGEFEQGEDKRVSIPGTPTSQISQISQATPTPTISGSPKRKSSVTSAGGGSGSRVPSRSVSRSGSRRGSREPASRSGSIRGAVGSISSRAGSIASAVVSIASKAEIITSPPTSMKSIRSPPGSIRSHTSRPSPSASQKNLAQKISSPTLCGGRLQSPPEGDSPPAMPSPPIIRSPQQAKSPLSMHSPPKVTSPPRVYSPQVISSPLLNKMETSSEIPEKPGDALATLFSALYGKLLVVMGIAFPMAEVISTYIPPSFYEVYYLYLYIGSMIFLLFMYATLLWGRPKLPINIASPTKSSAKTRSTSASESMDESDTESNSVHNKRLSSVQIPTARRPSLLSPLGRQHHYGSFYLRMGAVAFGIGSMIYSGLEFGQYFELNPDTKCHNVLLALTPATRMAFIFIQMYFIFLNNEQIKVYRYKIIARFGLMHMIGTNLAVWLNVLIQETKHEILTFYNPENRTLRISHRIPGHSRAHSILASSEPAAHLRVPRGLKGPYQIFECRRTNILGTLVQDASPFLFPCTIEYSLICAAILYVMWKSISRPQAPTPQRPDMISSPLKRSPHHYSVDCARAHKGLFVGILVLVLTIISLILFFVLISRPDFVALAVLEVTMCELFIYATATIATLVGMIQIRHLEYDAVRSFSLDDILLVGAQTGSFLYNIFTVIAGHFSVRSDDWLVPINALASIVQTACQTMFILDAGRRQAITPEHMRKKPGREIVTFMLVVNLAMWAISTLEKSRAESHPIQLNFYGLWAWTIITHVSMPLAIFYRFHSTVCLCEIWKRAYKMKPTFM
ncbi:proton channel otopetrin-like c isoform 3-T11 [Glossina fuscipes fuscipes]